MPSAQRRPSHETRLDPASLGGLKSRAIPEAIAVITVEVRAAIWPRHCISHTITIVVIDAVIALKIKRAVVEIIWAIR
jgi:hypothetical protein